MSKNLIDICKSSLEELKRELVLGASNKSEDRIQTGGWNVTLVNTSRYDYEYKKDEKDRFSAFFTPKEDVEPDIVSIAISAKLNRCGNCQEQTCLACILILNQLANNGMLDQYDINFCSLEKPYDHAFLKITSKDASNPQELFFDPWLGQVFNNEKQYLQTVRDVLLKEAIDEDNDKQAKKYPNMLFSNPEFIQFRKEDEKDLPKVQTFSSLTTSQEKAKLMNDFKDRYNRVVSEQYSSDHDESLFDVLEKRSKLQEELKKRR